MNDTDAQEALQTLTNLIEHKDAEIARWKVREKESYEKGFARGKEEGQVKAWEIANAIVHLKWDGAYVPPDTVEEWFENYTAEEAGHMLEVCRMKQERPHWVRDDKCHCFVCSHCKSKSDLSSCYCPWCGKEMER